MAEDPRKLFVGQLPNDITEDEVRTVFTTYGAVSDVHIMDGKPPGTQKCGFVTYEAEHSAKTAVDLLNDTYKFRQNSEKAIRVSVAKGKGARDSGKGGGRDGGYDNSWGGDRNRGGWDGGGRAGDRAPAVAVKAGMAAAEAAAAAAAAAAGATPDRGRPRGGAHRCHPRGAGAGIAAAVTSPAAGRSAQHIQVATPEGAAAVAVASAEGAVVVASPEGAAAVAVSSAEGAVAVAVVSAEGQVAVAVARWEGRQPKTVFAIKAVAGEAINDDLWKPKVVSGSGGGGGGAREGDESKVFVGQLPMDIREDEVRTIFGTYGQVTDVKIIDGKPVGSQKCAFVGYEAEEGARVAIQVLHDVYRFRTDSSKPIRVEFCKGKGGSRDAGGGGGGGG
eukprot:CAMPEP_0183608872 /NCGR_PEP_ID=MMETSP0371-20130417/184178_1 /TAXON_ID=268820 /ORGANISM="Peridinium aciculiferum, Strain PAER-2" /LENGTH=389 /DNA_ID=CAMNT_0025820999 /DNA_START=26 /DNA_END=1194 /DNA_ORIENTATION=+